MLLSFGSQNGETRRDDRIVDTSQKICCWSTCPGRCRRTAQVEKDDSEILSVFIELINNSWVPLMQLITNLKH